MYRPPAWAMPAWPCCSSAPSVAASILVDSSALKLAPWSLEAARKAPITSAASLAPPSITARSSAVKPAAPASRICCVMEMGAVGALV